MTNEQERLLALIKQQQKEKIIALDKEKQMENTKVEKLAALTQEEFDNMPLSELVKLGGEAEKIRLDGNSLRTKFKKWQINYGNKTKSANTIDKLCKYRYELSYNNDPRQKIVEQYFSASSKINDLKIRLDEQPNNQAIYNELTELFRKIIDGLEDFEKHFTQRAFDLRQAETKLIEDVKFFCSCSDRLVHADDGSVVLPDIERLKKYVKELEAINPYDIEIIPLESAKPEPETDEFGDKGGD